MNQRESLESPNGAELCGRTTFLETVSLKFASSNLLGSELSKGDLRCTFNQRYGKCARRWKPSRGPCFSGSYWSAGAGLIVLAYYRLR